MVVFVPGGTPGDVVEVAAEKEQRSFLRARLLRVITPGPARVDSPCPHAVPQPPALEAACGGCPLMALDRSAQLAAKQAWVTRALRMLPVQILPILDPAPALGYRLRARLVVRGGRLGFAGARSHRAADMQTCPVLVPALDRVLLGHGRVLARLLGEDGVLHGLIGMRGPDDAGRAMDAPAVHVAALLGQGGDLDALRAWLLDRIGAGEIAGASLGRPHRPAETLGLATVDLGPPLPGKQAGPGDEAGLGPLPAAAGGFAQACAAGHDLLPRLVAARVAAAGEGGRVLELYSGSGNLTRALWPISRQMLCVEGDAGASARADALLGAHAHVQRWAQPVDRALSTLIRAGETFDCIVLDPPREGARDAAALLPQLKPRRIVYVSCDVMTLARDLMTLHAAGLQPRTVQPIDLMPHTAEVECIAVCEPVG